MSHFETALFVAKCLPGRCLMGLREVMRKMIPIVRVPLRLTWYFKHSHQELSNVNGRFR